MMKFTRVSCIIFLLVITAPDIAGAIVMPDRSIILNPLSVSTESNGIQLLTFMGGWAELDKYLGIAGDSEHCFDTRLGAAAEVLRLANDFNLTVSSDVELVATPDSPIYFNPRAIFWQEAFQFGTAIDSSFVHLGYVHRCKHDVDNLQASDSAGERRIMVPIYDSFFARLISRAAALTSSAVAPFTTQFYCRADLFVLMADERSIPLPDKNFYNLRYGISAGLNSSMFRIGAAMAYTRLQYNLYSFAGSFNPADEDYSEFSADYSAEAGVNFPGKAGGFSLFMNFEKQDFTMINPRNESRFFVQFGIRMTNTDMYY